MYSDRKRPRAGCLGAVFAGCRRKRNVTDPGRFSPLGETIVHSPCCTHLFSSRSPLCRLPASFVPIPVHPGPIASVFVHLAVLQRSLVRLQFPLSSHFSLWAHPSPRLGYLHLDCCDDTADRPSALQKTDSVSDHYNCCRLRHLVSLDGLTGAILAAQVGSR